LKSLIEQDGEVSLDASHIQKADAVSLQMLAAFYQSGPAQGIKVNWSGCSEDFREFGELLGITEILGINSVQ